MCLNRLDSIGIAGFSHNFGCLEGKRPPVSQVFEAFGNIKLDSWAISFILLAQGIPIFWKIPTKRQRLTKELNRSVEEIAEKLLAETRKEKLGQTTQEDKSLIGLLSMCHESIPEIR